ncbi:MAG: hypothetical protein QGI78_03525 [Phycisphaerales bacterium]|nr:hypothetical protein [Phycisphaerales bacterium]
MQNHTTQKSINATPSRAVCIVSGQPVRLEEMWPFLVEAKGKEIFHEIALGYMIEDSLQRNGFPPVIPDEIAYEKQVLLNTTGDQSQRELEKMLDIRGYGKERFDSLCVRNAGLRKLIQQNVTITEDSIHRMFALIHGPRYPTRIIVTSTLEEATTATNKINEGIPFSTIAATHSIDQSSANGGVVEPISPVDPAWPSSVRERIQSLPIGQCSEPILIGDRWILVTVTSAPSKPTAILSDVEGKMELLSRLAIEQLEMEKLSNSLQENIRATIIDTTLKRTLNR